MPDISRWVLGSVRTLPQKITKSRKERDIDLIFQNNEIVTRGYKARVGLE